MGLGEGRVLFEADGVQDHARFRALDLVHLARLALGVHIAMDDAHASHPRQGYGEARLGDRVHGRREKGDVEPNVAGHRTAQVDMGRQGVAHGWHDEDIVEGEGRLRGEELFIHAGFSLFLFFSGGNGARR